MTNPEIIRLAFEKGYRITRDGRVLTKSGRFRRVYFNPRGYGSFGIKIPEGRTRRVEVHRLLAYQKFGEESLAKNEGRHLDGNPSNNRWENITIGSHSQNMLDQHPAARQRKAQAAADQLRRFSDGEVKTIRSEHKNGFTYSELAKRWKVSKGLLSYMLSRSAKHKSNY